MNFYKANTAVYKSREFYLENQVTQIHYDVLSVLKLSLIYIYDSMTNGYNEVTLSKRFYVVS